MNEYLEEHLDEMLQLLETFVNIDSGSDDKNGIDRIGDMIKDLFEEINFTVDVHVHEKYGNHLSIYHQELQKQL
ncbi:hypothetical protein [Aquibacillus albus]|uniref:Acetylornithine deacetylase/succinyl-diaminopimelate desuccinylase-like protein n=1 Tax=Aquibacillus albus TaxID=1168171 RepID=A0ABS2N2I6_9BACI|nr:acetylornithine deacetylase/succinyl-diaminopimelate desuccinylase-like protein [Aquibacillus albus]